MPCSEASGTRAAGGGAAPALSGEAALGADPQRIADQLVAEEKVRHVAVLIFMLYKDPALENDLRKAMAGGRYAVNSQLARIVLSELQEMKLVELIRFGRYKVYRLTPLGREVAEELARRAGFI